MRNEKRILVDTLFVCFVEVFKFQIGFFILKCRKKLNHRHKIIIIFYLLLLVLIYNYSRFVSYFGVETNSR